MTTPQFHRICAQAAKRAGLPKWLAPNTLRHSFAAHMSVSSRFCSDTRHIAHQQPAEGRIIYRFHPRFGETVRIRRRLERGGIAFVVVHQSDGSFACLPAWMFEPAASRFEIGTEPHFSVDILRATAPRDRCAPRLPPVRVEAEGSRR